MMEEFVFRIQDQHRERLDEDYVSKYVGKQPQWGPLGLVTFKRTYARRLTQAQRDFRDLSGVAHGPDSTEEFWEAIRRVTEGIFSILHQQVKTSRQRWSGKEAQQKMRQMFRLMWEGKFLPPGRGLSMIGADVIEKKGAAAANNCGMVGTGNIDQEFATPFIMLMDYSMLGVGMGFDTKGANKVRLQLPTKNPLPHRVPDTREGWCEALARVLNAFVGEDSLPSEWDVSQIRPEGSVIHTFGGTASGPAPLLELLSGVTDMLNAGVGRLITSTQITDIMNMIGRCVVAGNVRRSAEIALGDPMDKAFLGLKDPSALIELSMRQTAVAQKNPQWATLQEEIDAVNKLIGKASVLDASFNPSRELIAKIKQEQKALLALDPEWMELEAKIQADPLRKYRWASNNTVMCSLDQDYEELAKQTATNGEPGYAWLEIMRGYGRLCDPPNNADARAIGTNPCVPAGTRILTRDGYREIQTLVGQTVDVWNGQQWSRVEPKVTGHDQPLMRVTLSDGTQLVCTDYHKWILASSHGHPTRIETRYLMEGDSLAKFDMPLVEGGQDWKDAYTHGFYCGDGQTTHGSKGALLYGEKKALQPYLNIVNDVQPDDAYGRQWAAFPRDLPEKFVVRHDLSIEARLSWLAGYLDADGAVLQNPNSVCIQATSVQREFLDNVRLMLTTLGVQAKVSLSEEEGMRRLPDGKGGYKDYLCKRTWRLLINAYDTHRLVAAGLKTHRLDLPLKKPQRDARRFVTVECVEKVGIADVVYCFEEPVNHSGTFEGIVTANCGEQTLWDGELCCLVETFPSKHKSLDEYLLTLKYAYLYAKVVTLIPTHNEMTNAVIARNRRIGTSMAGIWEMYETLGLRECIRWWQEGYKFLRELDEEYSGWMGVSRSIKITSVKPGGTIPLLLGIEGGMKLPISRWYMRTIRIEEGSPLAQAVMDAGYRVEKDLTTPRTVVAYFPCKEEKSKRVARDVSIWEQAALFTALQNDWSDNQVSATLTFKPEEAGELDKVLSVYSGKWKSVSFLPLWDHQFAQAPYIPCTEEEYREALAKIRPLVLEQDVHDSEDKFCSGGLCELPAR